MRLTASRVYCYASVCYYWYCLSDKVKRLHSDAVKGALRNAVNVSPLLVGPVQSEGGLERHYRKQGHPFLGPSSWVPWHL